MAQAGADVPGRAGWLAAAEAVRTRHQPGDLIAFAPSWIDPVGREHLGDLIPIAQAARMDDARYATLWELSIRDASTPEAHGRDLVWQQTFAGVRVRQLTRVPAQVVTDFVEAFATQRSSARAQVPGTASLRVTTKGRAVRRPAVALEEVGFAPHRCVRVEPRPDETVQITYHNAALADELVGYVGLADVFTRRDVRDPGRLRVLIGDTELASVTFGVDDGWVRFTADTADVGQAADVTFAATAVGQHARQRLICFAAEARRRPVVAPHDPERGGRS